MESLTILTLFITGTVLIGPLNGSWYETVINFLNVMATAEHPDGTLIFNEKVPLIGKTINIELPNKLTELQRY